MDFTECLAVLERHREKQDSADLGGRCEENGSRCRAAESKAVGQNSGDSAFCGSGQVIDLLDGLSRQGEEDDNDERQSAATSSAVPPFSTTTTTPTQPSIGPSSPSSTQDETSSHLLAELCKMEVIEILHAFQAAQGSRVSTYKHFDSQFRDQLRTQNLQGLEGYCTLCNTVTATFAALSQTIICMAESLRSREGDRRAVSIASAIDKVQSLEKQKLMLVAAEHLELMRLRTLEENDGAGGEAEVTIMQKNHATLKEKIVSLEESISEAMENLRADYSNS